MKVGIMTFHRALNYGACLQAFALLKILEKLNIEAEIIDYRNSIIEGMYQVKTFGKRKGVKAKIKYILYRKSEINLHRKFDKFRYENLCMTDEYYSKDEELVSIKDSFDFYITGSDQVWNYNAHGFDKNYFLNFVANPQKRISYAASFGISSIPKEYQRDYSELLDGINALSVREEEGQKIVKDICGVESTVVLDPTLLLTREEWSEVAQASESTTKYILLYTFELTNTMKNFVEKLSNATGLEVRYFGKSYRRPLGVRCNSIDNADPLDFVRYFVNAEYVVTNSFHGTAFSINLNKSFFVELLIKDCKVNSRLENIIRLTRLESRIIRSDIDITNQIDDTVNWENVNNIIADKRDVSISFLKDALKIN